MPVMTMMTSGENRMYRDTKRIIEILNSAQMRCPGAPVSFQLQPLTFSENWKMVKA